MELILLVILSMAFGGLCVLFYMKVLDDKPLKIEQKQESGDNSIQIMGPVYSEDENNGLDPKSKVFEQGKSKVQALLEKIKTIWNTDKLKAIIVILFIISISIGAYIGYKMMTSVNDVIRDNQKRQTVSMVFIEPDSIHAQHLDDGSRVKYL